MTNDEELTTEEKESIFKMIEGLPLEEQKKVIEKAIRFIKQDITLEKFNTAGKYEPSIDLGSGMMLLFRK